MASVAATAMWLWSQSRLGGEKWITLPLVVGLHLWCVLAQRRRTTVTPRSVLLACGLLTLVAVIVPPYGSADVWSYAMYGRILGIQHVSPYTHSPADFALDPLVYRVNVFWLTSPSVYGPVFNVVSALGALMYGQSALRARLFFQGMAGLALFGSVLLLVRRQVDLWVIVLVGLAPGAVLAANGGHIDVIVGCGLLIGLLLVADEHPVLGGIALTATMLLKVVVLPAVGGLLLALALAKRWREARTISAVFTGLVLGAYAMAGGAVAIAPVQHGSKFVGRASWSRGLYNLVEAFGHHVPPLIGSANVRSALATFFAAAGLAAFAWQRRRSPDPIVFAAAAMVLYLATANYVLPWYVMAVLPVVALVGPRLRWYAFVGLVLMQFVDIQADYRHVPAARTFEYVAPFVQIAVFALVVWRSDPPADSVLGGDGG